MASRYPASIALLLSLNLLFFTMVSSTAPCSPPPKKGGGSGRKPYIPPAKRASCPKDALKLGVCANVLDLLRLKIGKPPKEPCCSLLDGLVDLEAAACLCTALKANVLGINLNIPLSLSLLVNYCGKKVPYGFQCA